MRNWSMQRKLYLYPYLLKELPELDEQIHMENARLKAAYGSSSPFLTGMPSGKGMPSDPSGNSVVDMVIPVGERLKSLEKRRSEKVAIIGEVEEFLDRLDALERAIVELRYLKRLTWFDVCQIEHISIASAYRLHDSAKMKCKDDSS